MKNIFFSTLVMILAWQGLAQAKPIDRDSLYTFVYDPWFQATGQLFNLCRFYPGVIDELNITKGEQQQIENVVNQIKQQRHAAQVQAEQGQPRDYRPFTHQQMYQALVDILGKDRAKRVQEIDYQRHAQPRHLFDRLRYDQPLAQKLLTKEQRKKILAVQREYELRLKAFPKKFNTTTHTPEQIDQAKKKFRADYQKAIVTALDKNIMTKWAQLMGKKYKGSFNTDATRGPLGGKRVG